MCLGCRYGFDCPTLWQLMDPRKSTYFTIEHEGPLYLFMGIILVVARVYCHVGWLQLAGALLLYGVMGSVGSALHASFHVKGFELEKYEWSVACMLAVICAVCQPCPADSVACVCVCVVCRCAGTWS